MVEPINADGLITTHQELMDLLMSLPEEERPFPLAAGCTLLKLALMALAEVGTHGAVAAFQRGQETLHAGDALFDTGFACTALAMHCHARLVAVQPRTLSVDRAGKLLLELQALGKKLAAAGGRMMDGAERAGHA